eukprot:263345_1
MCTGYQPERAVVPTDLYVTMPTTARVYVHSVDDGPWGIERESCLATQVMLARRWPQYNCVAGHYLIGCEALRPSSNELGVLSVNLCPNSCCVEGGNPHKLHPLQISLACFTASL